MKKEKFEVGEIIIDNVGAVDSFSDSLKKIVNAKANDEMLEKMQGLDLLFGVKLDSIKDCMNAMMVVNALKGSEKAAFERESYVVMLIGRNINVNAR